MLLEKKKKKKKEKGGWPEAKMTPVRRYGDRFQPVCPQLSRTHFGCFSCVLEVFLRQEIQRRVAGGWGPLRDACEASGSPKGPAG